MKKRLSILLFTLTMMFGCALSVQACDFGSGYYIIPDSNSRYLSQEELSYYCEDDLGYIRNEILARHGYIFKTAKYNDYFNSQSWYSGCYTEKNFDYNVLNDYEESNIALIKKMEKGTSVQSSYIIPDSNSRYLSICELKGCSSSELALIRNEIYARHGYIFKKAKYRDYFNSKSWYQGCYTADCFDEGVFNDYEQANIDLIKCMEEQL